MSQGRLVSFTLFMVSLIGSLGCGGVVKTTQDTPPESVLPVGSSYTMGPANALVTIVEFSEFQCPFCSRVQPTLKRIFETYKGQVRLVFKHNPLSFHKDAPLAAKAAIAAGKQGKFWQLHDLMFDNQRALKPADIEGYARQAGLNMATFQADLKAPTTQAMVEADMALAKTVGARGTPNFFINGKQLRGAQPFDRFKEIIDGEVIAAKAALKSGVKPGWLYSAMVKKNYQESPAVARARRVREAANVLYKIPVGDSLSTGPKDALVTIIKFSEFQCPFCARVQGTLRQLKRDYEGQIRLVFKHNPLPFHKDAPRAAKAALAAGLQGKFWEMHDVLFENIRNLDRASIDGYAERLGLDMKQFEADLESSVVQSVITADQALAKQFGARGTPTFFINGRKLVGARPLFAFKARIDAEIVRAKKLLAGGTPRNKLYETLVAKGKTKADPDRPRPPKRPKDDKTVYTVEVHANDAVRGNPKAPVTIVEFSEFQCPFCARVTGTLDRLRKHYGDKVRLVFKHNPLPFHKDAPLAAQAAIAAGKQGKFWELHDLLFENYRALKPENIEAYAEQLGLDMARFNADLHSEEAKQQIERDKAQAKSLNARGTPHFFINGRRLRGAQPYGRFKALIDELLKP